MGSVCRTMFQADHGTTMYLWTTLGISSALCMGAGVEFANG